MNREAANTSQLEAKRKLLKTIARFEKNLSDFSKLCRDIKVPLTETRIEIMEWTLADLKDYLNNNKNL